MLREDPKRTPATRWMILLAVIFLVCTEIQNLGFIRNQNVFDWDISSVTYPAVSIVNGADKISDTRRSLTDMMKDSGTGKQYRHHFDRYYKKWLAPYRDLQDAKILEIGAKGGKSLSVWVEYFSLPELIVGLAYGVGTENVEDKNSREEKVKIIRGDQSKKETMDQLNELGSWDVIIDDGSHHPEHVIFSLFSLWKSVRPGGIYVVEDLETGYWKAGTDVYGYKLHGGMNAGPKENTSNKIKQFIEILQRHHLGVPKLSIMPGDEWMCSVEFGMNLVVLRKCTEEDMAESPGRMPWDKVDRKEVNQWLNDALLSNPQYT